MRIAVIPDSFKGSLSSASICAIVSESAEKILPKSLIRCFPIADGGEGSIDAFLSCVKGERVSMPVKDAHFRDAEASFAVLENGQTAVIELAQCASLSIGERGGTGSPMYTTTFGTGQMIKKALGMGCKKIIMCLGGSCTNDFGAGAAAAAGIKFFDKNGKEFIPVGASLIDTERIDLSAFKSDAEFICLCDVENTVYGETGAAYVFAPQKGANEIEIEALDKGLRKICSAAERETGISLSSLKGGGAAGGMGAGMKAFFNANLKSGIDEFLNIINFEEIMSHCDLIITGEGRIDRQSLSGKVICGIGKRAKEKHIPVIALCGEYTLRREELESIGISCAFSINTKAQPFSESRLYAEDNLRRTAENIFFLINIKNPLLT